MQYSKTAVMFVNVDTWTVVVVSVAFCAVIIGVGIATTVVSVKNRKSPPGGYNSFRFQRSVT